MSVICVNSTMHVKIDYILYVNVYHTYMKIYYTYTSLLHEYNYITLVKVYYTSCKKSTEESY
jgi:hypothetical protein